MRINKRRDNLYTRVTAIGITLYPHTCRQRLLRRLITSCKWPNNELDFTSLLLHRPSYWRYYFLLYIILQSNQYFTIYSLFKSKYTSIIHDWFRLDGYKKFEKMVAMLLVVIRCYLFSTPCLLTNLYCAPFSLLNPAILCCFSGGLIVFWSSYSIRELSLITFHEFFFPFKVFIYPITSDVFVITLTSSTLFSVFPYKTQHPRFHASTVVVEVFLWQIHWGFESHSRRLVLDVYAGQILSS